MKAILVTRENFTKELTLKHDDFRQVIAVAKYPHVGVYEDADVDVSKPDDYKMLFYYERQYFDEHNAIVLIYKER